jgi:periplasmic copper chaperone A
MKLFTSGITLSIALLLASSAALAHSYSVGDIAVEHPWARPTVAGQQAGGGYMVLTNKGKQDDKLLRASSPAAARVELHTMSMDGNVMRMREVADIAVKAGGSVELKPGALHVMFMGLKAPLTLDSKIAVTLEFEKAGKVTVDFNVELAKAPAAADEHKHKH